VSVWDILLDLDDTLIPSSYKYGLASWRCGLIIAEALGERSPRPSTIIQLHDKIDSDMAKQFGVPLDRFPRSWVTTYETVCQQIGVRPKPSVKKLLKNPASRFKFGPFRPFTGAHRALAELKKCGHRLHLVTAGVDSLQNRKIDQAKLRRYFDSIHITTLEKKAVMTELVGDTPDRAIMIGDSKRSDIQPAKKLGIVTVWVPSPTRDFANAPVEPDHQIATISELPALVRKIVKGKK